MQLRWLERRSWHAAEAGSIPRCGKGFFFSPRVNFQCRSSYGVRTPPVCTHVKDPVVHVRVRWIMQTLKHPACTAGWVARLRRSCLSPGKATRFRHGIPKRKHAAAQYVPRESAQGFLSYLLKTACCLQWSYSVTETGSSKLTSQR